jgi:endonuclease/exonuclease/phosphatase (EEP) superfamily protein YafD
VRDQVFRDAARWVEHTRTAAIIAGDFNATPWSGAFERLRNEAGLDDSSLGFGVQPSWPSWLGPLGIPIDHCLYTGALAATARSIGPALGSDHRALTVELAWDDR